VATMMNSFENPNKGIREPYYLNPKGTAPSTGSCGSRDVVLPGYNNHLKAWTLPNVMALINTRIVRRSAGILQNTDETYGPNFRYSEVAKAKSFLSAMLIYIGMFWFVVIAHFSVGRSVLKKYLPSPGEGPSEKLRNSTIFKYELVAKTESGKTVVGVVSGGDPGYSETAKMLSESAITLLENKGLISDRVGFLTPATCMGKVLIDRLHNKGLKFEIKSE